MTKTDNTGKHLILKNVTTTRPIPMADILIAMQQYADQEKSSLFTQLTEMTAEKNKWFDKYVGADDKVEVLSDDLRIAAKTISEQKDRIDWLIQQIKDLKEKINDKSPF